MTLLRDLADKLYEADFEGEPPGPLGCMGFDDVFTYTNSAHDAIAGIESLGYIIIKKPLDEEIN